MKTSQNLVSVEQFSNQDVMAYLKLAQAFKNGKTVQLSQPTFAMNLFLRIAPAHIQVLRWPNDD